MNPELVVITSATPGQPDPAVVKTIIRAADVRAWSKRIVRQTPLVDAAGKPVCLLDSEEARKLYIRAHGARLAVWTTTDVWVQLNPTRYRLDKRYLISLSRLLRYKAFVSRVSLANFESVLADYGSWMTRVECDHERDPRVLPLHTFCPSADWTELAEIEGRALFAEKHGGPSKRTCEQRFHWTPDLGRDGGREPQQVAGRDLSVGYHWDVSHEQWGGQLLTLTDVWKVRRTEHLNVYPNGHVRGGENSRIVATVRTGSKRGAPRKK